MDEQQVRQEYSAGGVVYKTISTEYQVPRSKWLLGKHSGYHKWVLPKGLIEKGEKPEETAVREVAEETGVRAKIVNLEPVYIDKYSFQADYKTESGAIRRVEKYQEDGGGKTTVNKSVTYYLMEWVAGDPQDHDFEMEEVGWFSYEEAMEKLDFEGERQALRQAQGILICK
jgi:8-oxo-dGTP diphosphatase